MRHRRGCPRQQVTGGSAFPPLTHPASLLVGAPSAGSPAAAPAALAVEIAELPQASPISTTTVECARGGVASGSTPMLNVPQFSPPRRSSLPHFAGDGTPSPAGNHHGCRWMTGLHIQPSRRQRSRRRRGNVFGGRCGDARCGLSAHTPFPSCTSSMRGCGIVERRYRRHIRTRRGHGRSCSRGSAGELVCGVGANAVGGVGEIGAWCSSTFGGVGSDAGGGVCEIGA